MRSQQQGDIKKQNITRKMMELKKTVYSKLLCSSCEMVHVLENATESSTKHQICQDFFSSSGKRCLRFYMTEISSSNEFLRFCSEGAEQ